MSAAQRNSAALSKNAADETQARGRHRSRLQVLSRAAGPLNAIPLLLLVRVTQTFLFLRRKEGAACWI